MLATNPIVSNRRSSAVNTNSVNLRIIHLEPYSRSTFRDEADPNKLNISHDQLALNRDWQGMYESYTANQSFFDRRTWIAGNKDALRAANQGDDVTTNLEYYTLLYEPLKAALNQRFGVSGGTDPLQYLVENTKEIKPTAANGLNRSIRLHKNISDNFETALQNTITEGGVVPPHSGGLVIRFQTNKLEDGLHLSNHSLGMAFDMDYPNNKQYFLKGKLIDDPYFIKHTQKSIGVTPKRVTGWQKNLEYADFVNGFKKYMEGQQKTLNNMMNTFSRLGMLSIASAYRTELKQIESRISDWKDHPEHLLSFGMDNIFVENMRKSFTWGGDWWYQKDYTHFQAK